MTVARVPVRRINRPKTRRHAHLHAARRAAERLGLYLTLATVDQLAEQIANGKAQFIARESTSRTVWLVTHHGKKLKVVYQRRLKAILTVYANDMATRAEKAAAEMAASEGGTRP